MIVWGGGEGKEHSCHLYLYHLKGTILLAKHVKKKKESH